MIISKHLWFLFAFLCCTGFGQAEDKQATDYEVGLEKAKKEDKKFFLLFTNSNRCMPCKKFKSDIYDTKQFKDFAEKNLVLLTVDYSPIFDEKNKKTLQQVEQSFKLPVKIGQRGRGPWPYLMVFDSEGKQIFSGRAYDTARPDAASFLKSMKNM